ncbi:MAG: shikimate dehydrogenase [Alphaproteobacteria bacterium]
MPSGQAKLAGVMGWPVGHSCSPRLFGYWLDKYGIDGAYVPLAVEPRHFGQALRTSAVMGFRGINITVPHKTVALGVVDEADEAARRIGAVNAVTVRDDGSLWGANTDGFGFMAHLRARAPRWRAAHGPAVVIGAGGASRAICAALCDAGVPEVRIVNRTVARAEAVAIALGDPIKVMPWIARTSALEDASLVVNATTQGMAKEPALDLDIAGLGKDAVVYDIVYAPLETPLLRAARAAGNVAVDGLGMLIHQACPSFKAWFGVEPDVDENLRHDLAQNI